MKLEVGCGYAREAGGDEYPFNPRILGEDVLYLDVSRPQERVRSFVVADAHHLPFREGAFGEVWMMHVLEHLREPLVAVSEVYRVLTEGGTLELEVPNMFSMVYELDPTHRWRLEPSRLKKLLSVFREARIRVEGVSPKMVPVEKVRLLLAKFLPRVPWPVGEYLRATCRK